MFTDDRMRDYCLEIRSLEREMEALYRRIAENIKDPYYQSAFHALAEDEKRHDDSVEKLLELFSEKPLHSRMSGRP